MLVILLMRNIQWYKLVIYKNSKIIGNTKYLYWNFEVKSDILKKKKIWFWAQLFRYILGYFPTLVDDLRVVVFFFIVIFILHKGRSLARGFLGSKHRKFSKICMIFFWKNPKNLLKFSMHTKKFETILKILKFLKKIWLCLCFKVYLRNYTHDLRG